ncbi:MAG TPA: ISL3 family transposase [Arachidicoccus soli]|nr:ISL3 family transposase [Arachidicoccus soli]
MEFDMFLQEMLGITKEFAVVQVEKMTSPEKITRIYLKYQATDCVVDGKFYPIYDYAPEREWQHLGWFEYKCYLIAKLPRYKDKDGKIKTYKPNFSPPGRSYTNFFRSATIQLLQKIKVQNTVAEIMRTTPYIVRSIMEDAVEQGMINRGEVIHFNNISIDEKAYTRGHHYATIIMDSDKEHILDLQEGRREKDLKTLLYLLSGQETLPDLNIVNMDMWKPYMNVIKEVAPQATIVHDNFHVVKKLTEAIDNTRKKEVKNCDLLKFQKFNVLKNSENRSDQQKKLFTELAATNINTTKAWQVRENYKVLWSYINLNKETAKDLIKTWIDNSKTYAIEHVNKALNTIEAHIEGIAAALMTRTSSGLHENTNGRIQSIVARARGFANFERFRINALFYYGNLQYNH